MVSVSGSMLIWSSTAVHCPALRFTPTTRQFRRAVAKSFPNPKMRPVKYDARRWAGEQTPKGSIGGYTPETAIGKR
jgi:hypothetical protein